MLSTTDFASLMFQLKAIEHSFLIGELRLRKQLTGLLKLMVDNKKLFHALAPKGNFTSD